MLGFPPSPAASTVSYRSGAYEDDYLAQNDAGRVPFWTESLNLDASPRLTPVQSSQIQGYPFPILQQIADEPEDPSSSSVAGDDDILLCLFNRGEKFGAAFYEVEDATLYLVSDKIDPNYQNTSFELLRNLARQVNPAHLIVSAGQGKDMLTVVRQICGLPAAEGDTGQIEKSTQKVKIGNIQILWAQFYKNVTSVIV